MKRQFKFRVWGYTIGKYLEGAPFGFDDLSKLDEVEIEQFTGLQDSEGRDIYEGDILKIDGESRGKLVYFQDGCFIAGHALSLIGLIMVTKANNKTLKVVGNVLENPELV